MIFGRQSRKLFFFSFVGSGCCCTFEAFWMFLLVRIHSLNLSSVLVRITNDLGFTNHAVVILTFVCAYSLSWELASVLKEANPTFDSSGVKLIAVGVGTLDKAHILAEQVCFPIFFKLLHQHLVCIYRSFSDNPLIRPVWFY